MKKRLGWIDSAKGIGIMLVVFQHICNIGSANILISSFHMPLFFFLSGYVYDEKKYRSFMPFLKQKIRTIAVPYVCFFILYQMFFFASGIFPGWGKIFSNFFFPRDVFISGPLWFLCCLFWTEIIFFFVADKTRSKYRILAMVLVIFAMKLLFEDYFHLLDNSPWNFRVAMVAVVFYGVGFVLKKVKFEKKSINFWAAILLLMVNIFLSFKNIPIFMKINSYGNYFYFFAAAFAGIFYLLYVAKKMENWRVLNYIGKNTIIIFSLHNLLLFKLDIFFSMSSVVPSLLYMAIVIMAIIPVVEIINKSFPYLIGRPIAQGENHPV